MDHSNDVDAIVAARILKKAKREQYGLSLPSPRRKTIRKHSPVWEKGPKKRNMSSPLLLWKIRKTGVVLRLEETFWETKWNPRFLVLRSRGVTESTELLIFEEHNSSEPRLCLPITLHDTHSRVFTTKERLSFGPFGFVLSTANHASKSNTSTKQFLFQCMNEDDEKRWMSALEMVTSPTDEIFGLAATPSQTKHISTSISRRHRNIPEIFIQMQKAFLRDSPWRAKVSALFSSKFNDFSPVHTPKTTSQEIGQLCVEINRIELCTDTSDDLLQASPSNSRYAHSNEVLLSSKSRDKIPDLPRPSTTTNNKAPSSHFFAGLQRRRNRISKEKFRQQLNSLPRRRSSLSRLIPRGQPDSPADQRHVLTSPVVCGLNFHEPSSLAEDSSRYQKLSSRPLVSLLDNFHLKADFPVYSSQSSVSIDITLMDRGYGLDDSRVGRVIGSRLIGLHEIIERDAQRLLRPVTQWIRAYSGQETDGTMLDYDAFHSSVQSVKVKNRILRAPDGWAWYGLRRDVNNSGLRGKVSLKSGGIKNNANSALSRDMLAALHESDDIIGYALCRIRFRPKLSGLISSESRSDDLSLDQKLDTAKVFQYIARAEAVLKAFIGIQAKIMQLPTWKNPAISIIAAALILMTAFTINSAYLIALVPLSLLAFLGITLLDRLSGEYARSRIEPPIPAPPTLQQPAVHQRPYRRTAWLRVAVLKGRNLRAADLSGLSDPYVRLSFQYAENLRPLAIGETRICRQTLNPIWTEPLYPIARTGHQTGFDQSKSNRRTLWDRPSDCGLHDGNCHRSCDNARHRFVTTSWTIQRYTNAKHSAHALLRHAFNFVGRHSSAMQTRLVHLKDRKTKTPLGFKTTWVRSDGLVYPESFRIPVLEPIDETGNVISFDKCQGQLQVQCFDADGINGGTTAVDDFLGRATIPLSAVPRHAPYTLPLSVSDKDGWIGLRFAKRMGLPNIAHFRGSIFSKKENRMVLPSDICEDEDYDAVQTANDASGQILPSQKITDLENSSESKNAHPHGQLQIHCVLELPPEESSNSAKDQQRPTPAMWAEMLTYEKLLEVPRNGPPRDWFLKRVMKTFSIAVDKQRQLHIYVRSAEQVLALLTWRQPTKTALVACCILFSLYICLAVPSRTLITLGVVTQFGSGYIKWQKQNKVGMIKSRVKSQKVTSYYQRFYNLLNSLPTEPQVEAAFADQRTAKYGEMSKHSLRAYFMSDWCGKLWYFCEKKHSWVLRFGVIQDSRLLLWLSIDDALRGLPECTHILLHQGIQITEAKNNQYILIVSSAVARKRSLRLSETPKLSSAQAKQKRLVLATHSEKETQELRRVLSEARSSINLAHFLPTSHRRFTKLRSSAGSSADVVARTSPSHRSESYSIASRGSSIEEFSSAIY